MIVPSVSTILSAVIPAEAGIQCHKHRRKLPCIPAFAGMTTVGVDK